MTECLKRGQRDAGGTPHQTWLSWSTGESHLAMRANHLALAAMEVAVVAAPVAELVAVEVSVATEETLWRRVSCPPHQRRHRCHRASQPWFVHPPEVALLPPHPLGQVTEAVQQKVANLQP